MHAIRKDHRVGDVVRVDKSSIDFDDNTPVAAWVLYRSSPGGPAQQFANKPRQLLYFVDVDLNFTPNTAGIYTVVVVGMVPNQKRTVTYRSDPIRVT
jgi:hypothetical protein